MHKLQLIAQGSSNWERFIKRWGISFLIDDDILFDTFGDAKFFLKQVKKQNIDLKKIKHIIISHEHWDHISGLRDILEINHNVTVYLCVHSNEELKNSVIALGANLVEVKDLLEIKKGVFCAGEIQTIYKDNPLYEQSVIIQSDSSNAVVTGCAHPGIMNILRNVENNIKGQIDTLIGGFHLKDLDRDKISLVIRQIKNMGIRKAGPSHCAGWKAVGLFKESFQERFIKMNNGTIFEI